MYRPFSTLCILALSVLSACQSGKVETEEAEKTFTWNDPSFPVSYPGPYGDADSIRIQQSIKSIEHLANGRPERVLFPLSDSIKISLVNSPIEVISAQEFIPYFKRRHQSFKSVRYEAFNNRSVKNIPFDTEVFFNFGRWEYTLADGSIDERYSTFLIALDQNGKLNAVTEWSLCWPKNSTLTFTPNPNPSHFHYYSKSTIGVREFAVRASSTIQALFGQDTSGIKTYLADSLNYTPSCGLNTWLSKEDLARSLLDNDPFSGIDPISVIPFYQYRQNDHIVLIFNYESFLENGKLERFSYLRTFIFDASGMVKNILIQRRRVPNSVNWNWQDARR